MAEHSMIIEGGADDEVMPDADELYGHEGEDTVIAVRQDGPIRTQKLSTRLGAMLTFPGVGGAQKVLFEDPRRSRAVIMAIDTDIIIGADQNQTDSSYGAYWPKLTPLTIEHCSEVWVKTTGAATRVSVINEQWSR